VASSHAPLDRLFEQAMNLPLRAREAFLDGVCGPDQGLRDELGSLLTAHEAAPEYFDRLANFIVAPALLALADLPDDELAPGNTVSHYRILENIGRGGMGVVYAALDLSLGRRVALKFLSPHLSSEAAAKSRFVAEAKAASLLDHPNIGVIHEIGETEEGRLFIAMAHYEGETLQRRIYRGPLPIDEATDLTRQIAGALAASHRKGVIHRDVKPSNILITAQGVAKLLDFGIARVAGSELTREGVMPGTVAYMSPEQTRGEIIDHRTDLWSLGVVLCEMLTAVRPFQGEDDRILVHAIRHDTWVQTWHSNLAPPAPLTRIVERCLEKDASRRYGCAEELLADLDGIDTPKAMEPSMSEVSSPPPGHGRRRLLRYASLAALPGLLAAATLYRTVSQEPAPVAVEAAPSPGNHLAVLPLASFGSHPDDSYLADGLTAGLIAQLSRVRGLRVIARASVLPYKDSGKSAVDIGRELDVGTLLEGSVQTSGDQVRLTLHLVDTTSQEHLWAQTYESAVQDVSVVQFDIARRVTEALQAHPGNGEAGGAARTSTPLPEAYMLYLKGRFSLDNRDEESARKARDYFRRALDLDPTYAQAWTGWSDTLDVLMWLSIMSPGEAYAQSRAAAERALQIDPDLPEGHVSLARVLFRHHFEFEAAADHLRRAIELNPSHAEARQLYAKYLRVRGRFEEALEQTRMAADLDPLSPMHQIEIGVTLYMARRYDEALAHYQRILDNRPDFTSTYMFMALVHMQQQQYEQALAMLDRATPTDRWLNAEAVRAYIFAIMGRRAEGLDALERLSRTEHVSPWHLAVIHLGMGEHDRALDLLELAFDERAWQIPLLPVEPTFDALRSHPRFIALVDRMRP
jgi:serine/threonine protein kinase/tetratricopeptide (TPR) repeat protein